MTTYKILLKNFNENYLGLTAIIIIIQSCLGSAAAMYILKKGTSFSQMIQLTIVVIICMIVNGAILSQQKTKLVFDLFLVSLFISTVLIIKNLL